MLLLLLIILLVFALGGGVYGGGRGWLRYVLPALAYRYGADGALVNAELTRQRALTGAIRELCPDKSDAFGSQFMTTHRFASLWRNPMATLRHHVLRVIGGSPEKQMVWSYTGWIVATMAHKEPDRNRTVVKLPRYTVRSAGLARAEAYFPITLFAPRAAPQPTPIGLIDIPPEAVSQCPSSIVSRHESTRPAVPIDRLKERAAAARATDRLRLHRKLILSVPRPRWLQPRGGFGGFIVPGGQFSCC